MKNSAIKNIICHGLTFLFVLSHVLFLPMNAVAELPIANDSFVSFGQGYTDTVGDHMEVNQLSDRAVFQWDSFNIGAQNSVHFNQNSDSAIALNRIFQADASVIAGQLSAIGTIYLLNQNGIIFDSGAQIDVGSLVASTLDVDEDIIMNSSLTQAIENEQAAFFYDPATDTGLEGMGNIVVHEGAELAAAPNGRIFLFAPEIVNNGSINTPEGQTILAAAEEKVYLAASTDKDLRGLYVEVDGGGSVTNNGSIEADLGNVTLMGMAVNQNGRIRATTSVDLNGSIRLLARDTVTITNFDKALDVPNSDLVLGIAALDNVDIKTREDRESKLPLAVQSGDVVFGENSITAVVPVSNDLKSVPDSGSEAENPSTITSMVEVMGGSITLENNAGIVATGGKVTLVSTENPSTPAVPSGGSTENNTQIIMKSGSFIDVSGSTSAVLPMERNSLEVELRGFELRDSPEQRDGILSGATVQVDLTRDGNFEIADISAQVAAIPKTVDERSSIGGTVDIISEGSFVFSEGAEINFSGGIVNYESGYIAETMLLTSDGRPVPIGLADKNTKYLAMIGDNSIFDNTWAQVKHFDSNALGAGNGRFVEGYKQGADAGLVNFNVRNFQYDGGLVIADTFIDLSRKALAPGLGSLYIDLSAFNSSQQSISLVNEKTFNELQRNYQQGELRPDSELILSDTFVNRARANVNLQSNETLTVADDARVNLAANADFKVKAKHIRVDGEIRAPGGDVELVTKNIANPSSAELETLIVSEKAIIDTSGQWVNDFVAGNIVRDFNSLQFTSKSDAAVALNAGSIEIKSAASLDVRDGSVLKANAGAFMDAQGELYTGKGGDISLSAARFDEGASLNIAGKMQSYGFNEGGSLSLTAEGWIIANHLQQSTGSVLALTPGFFQDGGFNTISLNAVGDAGIVLMSGTQIDLNSENLVFTTEVEDSLRLLPTGTDLENVTETSLLPQYLRTAKDLTLRTAKINNADSPLIDLQRDTLIQADPSASIFLSSQGGIDLSGSIIAHGGNINFELGSKPIFQPDAIKLRAGSVLDVSATSLETTPNSIQQMQYKLFNAGDITLHAKQGYVLVEDAAVLDISGASQLIPDRFAFSDNPFATLNAEMKAGSLAMTASEGLFFDGTLKANAAPLATASGARFFVSMDESDRGGDINDNFSTYPLTILLDDLKDDQNFINQALINATSIKGELDQRNDLSNGVAYIDIDTINNAGLGKITLNAVNTRFGGLGDTARIQFNTDKALIAAESIRLNSPSLVVGDNDAQVEAPYISIGTDSIESRFTKTAGELDGSGSFTTQGEFIEFMGGIEFADADTINIESKGSIRLRGVKQGSSDRDRLSVELNTYGDINLTADQIYATSFTDAEINLLTDNSVLSTYRNFDGTVSPVLSAASQLSIFASVINHHGVIKAPMGKLDLNASEINLMTGSILSVSTHGEVIPFGVVDATNTWLYDIDSLKPFIINQPGDKTINLHASVVTQNKGATIDLSGGGDVFAYQFTPGRGGSFDVLDNASNNGAFAIVPDLNGDSYAHYDFLYSEGSGIDMGSSIYLSGVPGLEAGSYAILPSHYALLPGAWLISPDKTISAISPQQRMNFATGAPIAAGKYQVANTHTEDSQWSAFIVEKGSVAFSRSELKLYSANSFDAFADGLLPQDGGILNITANESLALSGLIDTRATNTGLGGGLSIQGADILVTEEQVNGFEGIQLQASALNDLDVGSILLGGARQSVDDGNGFKLSVASDQVVIDGSANLQVAELLLAAKDQVKIESGAVINATKASANRNSSLSLEGDSAFLQASSAGAFKINRTNSSGVNSGIKGTLILEDNASVFGSGALVMDSSLKTDVSGDFDTTGTLGFGAKNIIIGGDQSLSLASGLQLNQALLNSTQATDFVFSSFNKIEFYDDLALQGDSIVFNTQGFVDASDSGVKVNFNAADTLTFSNSSGGTLNASLDNNVGSVLSFSAGKIIFSDHKPGNDYSGLKDKAGSITFNGFDRSQLYADNGVFIEGHNDLNISGHIDINTPLITAKNGALFNLTAAGDLNYTNNGVNGAGTNESLGGMGAEINLGADSIYLDSVIQLHSGAFSATSKTGNVELSDNALVDVSGRWVDFDGDVGITDAGRVSLESEASDVILSEGTIINLAVVENQLGFNKAGNKASSGSLFIKAAQGKAFLNNAQLIVNSSSNTIEKNTLNTGGSFIYDVGSTDQLPELLSTIENSGFNGSVSIRLRQGDFNLNTDQQLSSDKLRVVSDQGNISIAGLLDASSESDGGSIYLAAALNLNLNSTAVLRAKSHNDQSQGGEVTLIAREGMMTFGNGALVDLSGAGSDASVGGKLNIRTPYLEATNAEKLRLNDQGLVVKGANKLVVEAFMSYEADSIDQPLLDHIRDDLIEFNLAETTVKSQLGNLSNQGSLKLLPSVEVFNTADISIDSKIDFNQWRKINDIEEGVFTLRSAGNLNIKNSISDGFNIEQVFVFPNPTPVETSILIADDSWSYRFVSGADLSSADIKQTFSGQGDFNLASNTLVRTGTGDMEFYIGNNLIFTDDTSLIYSAGKSLLKPYNSVVDGGDVLLPDSGTLNPVDLAFLNFEAGRIYYPFDGGNINMLVGGNIEGAGAEHIHTEWLYRLSGNNDFGSFLGDGASFDKYATTWGVNYDKFNQGIGALGGGDINIIAAGDITNLGVVVPTTAMQTGKNPDINGEGASNEILIQGGGDISIEAGRNILSNHYFVDQGNLVVEAGQNIGRTTNASLGLLIALGDGDVLLKAGGDVVLESVVQSSLVSVSKEQVSKQIKQENLFFNSAVNSLQAQSLYGDIELSLDTGLINNTFGSVLQGTAVGAYNFFALLPANLNVMAFDGSINFQHSAILAPSHKTELALLARKNIEMASEATFIMSELNPGFLPDYLNAIHLKDGSVPAAVFNVDVDKVNNSLLSLTDGNPVHMSRGSEPTHIAAIEGNIGNAEGTRFSLSKSARFYAGKDIINAELSLQNNFAEDVTQVVSGRDIVVVTDRDKLGRIDDSLKNNVISLEGPGDFHVIAGRNIDLGLSQGIKTIGDTRNPFLSDKGANIWILAGMSTGADYDAYINKYLSEDEELAANFIKQIKISKLLTLDVISDVSNESYSENTNPLDIFNQLSPSEQQSVALHLINDVAPNSVREQWVIADFFQQLKTAGVQDAQGEINDPGKDGFIRGFNAIDTLFSGNEFQGDVNLAFSTIQAQDGGDINLLTPGGSVDVGLPVTVPGFDKKPADLGIISFGDGSISGFAKRNFNVNQSRIKALDGGDILLWSSEGNIDAGRGSKAALSVPPPRITEDKDGNIQVIFPPAVEGSGIQTTVSTPNRPPGNVFLFAPQGIVDAGDAGISSKGNVLIAAEQVVNADNIDVGGVSIGVPTDTGVSSSVAGLGDMGSAAADSAVDSVSDDADNYSENQRQTGFLTVEIIGLGD